jgi:CBS-domain-containing membrane protein
MNEFKDKTLDQVMHTDVVTLSHLDSVTKAVELLDKSNFHHIPILDNDGQIVGIISQTDIDKISWGNSLFSNEKKRDLNTSLFETLLTKDIMTRNVHFLFPDQNVEHAIKIFSDGHFHAIPIIENGFVVGIVCPQDIMNLLL